MHLEERNISKNDIFKTYKFKINLLLSIILIVFLF